MWKAILLAGVFILPLRAESACTLQNLQGRYVAMIAGEFSGLWQKCNVRVDGNGLATGSCLDGTGDVLPLDPIQFSVQPSCFVSGNSASGAYHFALRVQPHKRGLIGRFTLDTENDSFEGPVVAVKRGK